MKDETINSEFGNLYVSNPHNKPQISSALASKVGALYGLDETAVSQLSALMSAGYSDKEIGKWISDVIGSRRDEQKNSLSSQIAEMRSSGLNPDLTGVGDSGSGVASSPAFEPLPSEGGNGSLASRFRPIFSDMIKLATFGVSAYTGFSNSLMQQGLQLAGFASEDVLSVLGNESGVVEDVDSFISNAIASRGLSGNAAKRYARELGSRVNAMPSIISRLENRSKHDTALLDSRLNAFKSSDAFIDKSLKILQDQQDIAAISAEADLLEREMKLKFLKEHPDYTEEKLNAELAEAQASARKAEADATNAEKQGTIIDKQGALLDKQIESQQLDNEGKVVENASDKSDSDVKVLQNDLRTIELNAIDEMLKYVEAYESADTYYSEHGARWDFRHHQWDNLAKYGPSKNMTSYNGEKFSRTRYKDYKKRIDEYYRKNPSKSHGKLRVGAGPVSAGVSF